MRNVITGADIEFAKAQGHSQIIVGPDTIITNVARESAERMNIRILEEGAQAVSINAVAPVSAPAPVSPAGTNKPFLPSDFMQGQQTGAPVISMKSQTSVSAYGEKPPYDMEHWRRQFPILENYVHVANCSQSPQSSYTLKASNEYLDSWGKMGMDWDAWMQEVYLSKCEFAKIINADPSEIAIGTSISEITSTLASSLNFNGKRNKIVVTDAEFPTIGNIWMAHKKYGAEIQFLPLRNGIIPEEEIGRAHV